LTGLVSFCIIRSLPRKINDRYLASFVTFILLGFPITSE
jgi:hypothetical protein